MWMMYGLWTDLFGRIVTGMVLLTKGCMNYQTIARLPTERVELASRMFWYWWRFHARYLWWRCRWRWYKKWIRRAASSGTILYDPFNPLSTPKDTDRDTIPDVIDDDNDNDGWPDLVELDRGSDIYDGDETPFNLYFGINTGVFIPVDWVVIHSVSTMMLKALKSQSLLSWKSYLRSLLSHCFWFQLTLLYSMLGQVNIGRCWLK